MADYESVIRNTTIATASDMVKSDIGIVRGQTVVLGEYLDTGPEGDRRHRPDRRAGAASTPMSISTKTPRRLNLRRRFRERQPGGGGRPHHDHHPLRLPEQGQPLRDAVNKYHRRAEGKSLIDMKAPQRRRISVNCQSGTRAIPALV
jgi:dihydropyrimidinase